jgi:prepilin-type N-terminal cleavage/methylation domain-containing protein
MKKQLNNKSGFTIIEVMIVIAIAGLMMVILFVAVPQASANKRDSERKAYAGRVFQAMEEYYKNNGHFLNPEDASDWARFLSTYMPEGSDPSTGESFDLPNPDDVEYLDHGGQSNVSHSVVIYPGGIPHAAAKPAFGQVVIAAGHICQSAHPDNSGQVLSDIAYRKAHIADTFAIVVFQEHGKYYCIDNYDDNTPP